MTSAGGSAWSDPAWRAEIVAWATAVLAGVGRRVVGEAEQPHVRPWSTVLRIPTDDGPVWCKALGSGTAHEAALLTAFAAWGTPNVVAPLAVDQERAWIILPDGGSTLRQTRPGGISPAGESPAGRGAGPRPRSDRPGRGLGTRT